MTQRNPEPSLAIYPVQCMTMLDWYAGMAMQGLLASNSPSPHNRDDPRETLAKTAFLVAEAMIAQAEKRRKEIQ